MNWINYDRLVTHLETMKPSDFRYVHFKMDGRPGCVACQCVHLAGKTMESAHACEIESFLSVTEPEATYLFGASDSSIDPIGWGRKSEDIYEALRRLAVVAARYQQPTEEPEAVAVVPDDAAFLQSVYALVRGPLVDARGE